MQPARQRPAARAGGSPRGSRTDASRSRVRAELGRSTGTSLAGGPWAAAGRGRRRWGGPPVRCARRCGAPPTRLGAREPGSWARRRLGGCCAPAPRAAAPGSPPRPRPGHARRRPTMTAPWRRLRRLVWEYWAGLLVCAFWIPDSRGMPHVIRIGKSSPEPGVSVRRAGGGNGGLWTRPQGICPPFPGGQGRVTTWSSFCRGQSSKAGVTGLTYWGGGGRAAGGEGRGRGALGALPGGQTSQRAAKRSSPNPRSGRSSRRLPARPAADRVLGPASLRSGSPGEGANFSSLLAPPGPLVPAEGMALAAAAGTQGTASHDGAASSSPGGRPWRRWPAFSPMAWGRGAAAVRFAPAAPPGGGLSGLGAAQVGEGSNRACPARRGKARRGTRVVCKVSGNPPAAGGCWRGCAQLSEAPASPHLSSPETLRL